MTSKPHLNRYLDQFEGGFDFVAPKDLLETKGDDFTILDVRERHEFESIRIEGSINLPRGFLEQRIDGVVKDANGPIVLVCKGSLRARLAAQTLKMMGFTQLRILEGGLDQWVSEMCPTKGGTHLEEEALVRYDRHLNLPGFTEATQKKLSVSRVLIVGCGGLGSPAIAYLAAAGIGHLRLVDGDRVSLSNLQRQIVHSTEAVGISKTASAGRFVTALNPLVAVESINTHFRAENADELCDGVDIVIDGTDNVESRYLINDACHRHKIPYVYGAVFRMEGEYGIFHPSNGGPCYRCFHPNPMPQNLSPSCDVAGVLGIVPGIIGLHQTQLALDHLTGRLSQDMKHMLFCLDLNTQRLRSMKLSKLDDCVTCASSVSIGE